MFESGNKWDSLQMPGEPRSPRGTRSGGSPILMGKWVVMYPNKKGCVRISQGEACLYGLRDEIFRGKVARQPSGRFRLVQEGPDSWGHSG